MRIRLAALDPFRGYATALATQLPAATRVLDAFHVVRLGNQMLDEVRRRVQQQTLGHRGHKHDPLFEVRRLLRHGAEHLTDRQAAKLGAALAAGDPDGQVTLPGSSPRPCARATAAPTSPTADATPKPYSTPCTPAPSPKPHASAAPCARGGPSCWPTSTPTGPPTAPPRR